MGGWDIHDDAAERMLPEGALLDNLGSGLKTLKDKLVAANEWNNSVIVVMSEFGRTLASNGNKGVDHGRGGLMLVLGGQIQQPTSTQITKAWNLSQTAGTESSTALAVLNDYRLVLSNVFRNHFGIPSTQLISAVSMSALSTSTAVFPTVSDELTFRQLGMFKS